MNKLPQTRVSALDSSHDLKGRFWQRLHGHSIAIELKDEEGLLGDLASRGTFREILDKWRKPPRKSGEDPVRKGAVENISKKVFDAMLVGEDTEASAVVHSAIENFAPELAHVTRRFLKSKAGEKPECIAVGGRPLLQPTSTTSSKTSRPRSAP